MIERGESKAPADGADGPGAPGAGVDPGALPHALTFFLNGAQRRAVLARLRRVDRDRARALLRALRIETD